MIDELQVSLQDELEPLFDLPMYVDREGLTAGYLYNKALATAHVLEVIAFAEQRGHGGALRENQSRSVCGRDSRSGAPATLCGNFA
jgi:hypothetical protein